MGDQIIRATLGLLAAVLLAGCTNATAGSPTSGNTPAETTSGSEPPRPSEPNRYGAPQVTNPLDPSRFFTNPCAVIPPPQRPALSLDDPAKPDTTTALGKSAPNCSWANGFQGGGVAFLRSNRNGLADLYRQNAIRPNAYWEEVLVEGYPAVFHGTPDLRSRGNCGIAVGLNDALAMSVLADDRPGAAVCERAKQIATVAVKTIKEAG